MVVCAVRYEPVSIGNSLLSGNLTGNFANFCSFASSPGRNIPVCQALRGEFPKKPNREFFQSNRELQFEKQGISESENRTTQPDDVETLQRMVRTLAAEGDNLPEPQTRIARSPTTLSTH